METRTALLDHAESLSRSVGFNGFSFADLSAGAGIRKASVHYHFATKAALAESLIARYRIAVMEALSQIEGGAGQRLQSFLQIYRAALGEGKSVCLCVAMSASRDCFDDAALAELDRFQKGTLNWLRGVFEMAQTDKTIAHVVDPMTEARATFALVEGAQLMARAAVDPTQFDAATALLSARTKEIL